MFELLIYPGMTIQEQIKELEIQLTATTDLKERAEIILKIIRRYSTSNIKDARNYIEELRQLAIQLNSDEFRAWTHCSMGSLKIAEADNAEAVKEFEEAIRLFGSLSHNEGLVASYNMMGVCYHEMGNYAECLNKQSTALAIATQIDYKRGIISSYTAMGAVHFKQGNFKEALATQLEALKIRQQIGDEHGIATSYLNMNGIYQNMGNYAEALSCLLSVQKIYEVHTDKRGIASMYLHIGELYFLQGNYPEALSNYLISLKKCEALGDIPGACNTYSGIGNIYSAQGNYPEALSNYSSALRNAKKIGAKLNTAVAYGEIGVVCEKQGDYTAALSNHFAALEILQELGVKESIATAYVCIGKVYYKKGDHSLALSNLMAGLKINDEIGYKEGICNAQVVAGQTYISMKEYIQAENYLVSGLKIAEEIKHKARISEALRSFYLLKKAQGDGMVALSYYEQFVEKEKELQNEETSKKIASMQFGYKIEKKEQEVVFERTKKEEVQSAYELLDKEKQRSESLLLNILPSEIAEELKAKGEAKAQLFDGVTVLFTDFKEFTKVSERLTPEELVAELNACFIAFDEIVTRYGIEKIKTIGDAYMAVSGLPVTDPNHAANAIKATLEMRDFMLNRRRQLGNRTFEVRLGLHSGKVVAGIVGVKKFAYDIWGDTVNTAARMEQNGVPGKVNISEVTYQLVKHKFSCEYRGEIEAKNKGRLKMYFAEYPAINNQ